MASPWLAVALDVLLTARPTAGPLEASIGRTKLGPVEILDEPAPGIVLADFAATSPEDHPCLALELARSFAQTRGMPVYFTGATQTRLLYSAEMATGVQLGLLTPADRIEPWCAESKPKSARKPVLRRDTISINEVVRSLGWIYDRQPLRLYWIAGDFRVYDWRQYFGRPSRRPLPGDADIVPPPVPGLVDFLLTQFAQPPVTIFAAYLPGASREVVASAQYLAQTTGGRTGELFPLLTQTARLPVARIEIPENERDHGPGLLRIRDSSGKEILHRPFTFERPPPDRPKLDPLVGRVVTYSTEMSLKSGCGGVKEGARFELDLPARIRETPGRLLVHIEFQEQGKRSLRQRALLERPGPLCIVPQEVAPGTKFLIVVHDPATGWTGAKNGNITSR